MSSEDFSALLHYSFHIFSLALYGLQTLDVCILIVDWVCMQLNQFVAEY